MRLRRNKMWGWVDPNQPIDWNYRAVNDGTVSWWLNLPNGMWGGGRTFRDLNRGRQNEGTLTNFAFPPTSTSGWQGPQGRPGGYGSLGFDGVDDYVQVADAASLQPAAFTASFWIRQLVTAIPFDGILGKTNGTAWTLGWGFFWNAATELRFFSTAWSTNAAVCTLVAGVWNYVVGTSTGSVQSLYVNGNLVSGPTSTAHTPAAFVLDIGRLGSDAFNVNALMDDVRFYDRALSAAAVCALYDQSCRGHPDALRWLSTRAYFLPQQGGASIFRSSILRSRIIHGGAA